jgi:hypothetical protein
VGVCAVTDGDRNAIIKDRLKDIQYRPALIDAFVTQTGLTLEPP